MYCTIAAAEVRCGVIQSDPYLRKVVAKWEISIGDLEDLFWELIESPARQVVRGHFVAASALSFTQTLDFLLQARAEGKPFDESVERVIEYFARIQLELK